MPILPRHSSAAVMQSESHSSTSAPNLLTAAKGGGILFVGQLFAYVSRLIFGIIVARAIGAEGYGLYTLGITVVTVSAGIALLGLEPGMVHFLPAALRERGDARVWGILQVGLALPVLVGLGLAGGVFGLAGFLAENLLHEPAAVPVLRSISICIPILALGRILMAAARGFKRMQYQVYADHIAFNLIRIGLTMLLLAMGWGVQGALIAYTASLAVADGLLFYFLNQVFSLRRPLHTAQRDVRQLLSFSVPLCLHQVVIQFGGGVELFLLGMMDSVASVGVYSSAMRFQVVGVALLSAIEMATRPVISDLYHQGKTVELGRFYQTLTRWSLSFVLPYFLTATLFGRPMLGIFGKEFEAGTLALIIMSAGTLVNAGTGICGSMIVMTGHSKLTFLDSALVVILNTTLNIILIPVWGVTGAAAATGLAKTIVNIVRLLQVYWLLHLWPCNRSIVKPLVASIIALFVGLLMNCLIPAESSVLYLILNVAALWLTYVVITILLGLSAEDQMVLFRVRRRFSTMLVQR